MINISNNNTFVFYRVIGILILFFAGVGNSYGVVTSISGSISYGYGYARAAAGGESEQQSLTISGAGTGFVWQPWFIQMGAGLTVAFSRSDSSTSNASSRSRAWGGSLSFTVFPVSRFPFSLSISHGSSLLGNTESFGGAGEREFQSTRVVARQSYLARNGWGSNLSYAYGRFESPSTVSTNEILNYDGRKIFEKSSLSVFANYTTSDDSNSDRVPENYSLSMNHNYIPGNELGMSNVASVAQTKTKGGGISSEATNVQAASSFSWRPEYKPFSFSGGVRIAANENLQEQNGIEAKSESNSASLSLGVNYRLTRKVAILMSAGGANSFEENSAGDETQRTSASFNVSTSYGSDQYSLGGFQYGWNVGGGFGGTSTSVKGDSQASEQTGERGTAGANIGHVLSRSWAPGRSSTLGLSISQSLSGSMNDEGQGGYGVGSGLGLSASTRGLKGTTFGGISLSHSYSIADSDDEEIASESMFASINVSRNQNINRLSALTISGNVQGSRQVVENQDSTTNRVASVNMNYRHSRAFGVYSLSYNTIAGYNLLFSPGEEETDSLFWDNSFKYFVGLLDLSLDISFNREGNDTERGSLRFRATRSF